MFNHILPYRSYGLRILAVSAFFAACGCIGIAAAHFLRAELNAYVTIIIQISSYCIIGLSLLGIAQSALIFINKLSPRISIGEGELVVAIPSGYRYKTSRHSLASIARFKRIISDDHEQRNIRYAIECKDGSIHAVPILHGMPIRLIAEALEQHGIPHQI